LTVNGKEGALNIDGTWKHNGGIDTIPSEMAEQLVSWGFTLPNNE
jgi:hypothetical protein